MRPDNAKELRIIYDKLKKNYRCRLIKKKHQSPIKNLIYK